MLYCAGIAIVPLVVEPSSFIKEARLLVAQFLFFLPFTHNFAIHVVGNKTLRGFQQFSIF